MLMHKMHTEQAACTYRKVHDYLKPWVTPKAWGVFGAAGKALIRIVDL